MIDQYGAIPFLRDGKGMKVVLVTSAGGYWIFPKGNYEPEHGKRGTAELEAFEEAGVEGVLHSHRIYRARAMVRGGRTVRLALYPLEVEKVLESWPEENRRKRKIVSLPDACKRMESGALKRCLKRFERDFPVEE